MLKALLRRIGDGLKRLARSEPQVSIFAPGNPRDTTSLAAMLAKWEAMLNGPALSCRSRATREDWMSQDSVANGLVHAETPARWAVADASGAGKVYARRLIAMKMPPELEPCVVATFVSNKKADVGAALVPLMCWR